MNSLFFVHVPCDLEMMYNSLIFISNTKIIQRVLYNQYVYQYRGRLRCKGTKTSTASFRTPDFDRRYLPLEHWSLYSSGSSST